MHRPPLASLALVVALATGATAPCWAQGTAAPASAQGAAPLASLLVAPRSTGQASAFDGTVEALRQTVVSAQVAGAVVALPVKVGDRVKAGQLLLRLDARAAEQQAGAAAAQVQAAQAALEAATAEVQRQRQLARQNYISQAALERAEAQFKTAGAQAAAQIAAAQAARTETGYFTVKAPYDGIVSELPVVLGDMAMPGRPLLTIYDPSALRVSAAVPESSAMRLRDAGAATLAVELPGTAARITPSRWQLLPATDPSTHTAVLRLDLPAGTAAAPGLFARVWLPLAAADQARILVPARAVVQRAELKAVYVLDAAGKPLLRQVRVGPAQGDQVEILAGLAAGERVALEPQAAARVR